VYCCIVGIGADLYRREDYKDRKDHVESEYEEEFIDISCEDKVESDKQDKQDYIDEEREAKHFPHIIVFVRIDQIEYSRDHDTPNESPYE